MTQTQELGQLRSIAQACWITKHLTLLQVYFCNFLDLSIESKSYEEVVQDKGQRNSMINQIKSIHDNKI